MPDLPGDSIRKDWYNVRIRSTFINLCTSDIEKAVSKFIKYKWLYIEDEIFDVTCEFLQRRTIHHCIIHERNVCMSNA